MDGAPQLSGKLSDSLDLIRSCGVEPTDAEIVWLAELRRRCDTPPGRESVSSCSSPVDVYGVRLWPLHLMAEAWFVDWFEAFEDDDLLRSGVYLFAHVHSKPGDRTLMEYGGYDAVKARVTEWLVSLPVPQRDLPKIMEACYALDAGNEIEVENPDKAKQADPIPRSIEERAAELCKAFPGTTPSYWLADVSKVEIMRMAVVCSADGATGEWAKSPLRIRRIASYLSAVKIISRRGAKADV
jgi:hypothetical protein